MVILGDDPCMHTITTRSPSDAEQQLIAERTKHHFASYGCIIVLFAIVPGYMLGKFGGWLGGLTSQEASTFGQWTGWLLSAVVFVSVLALFLPYERRLRRRAARDEQAQVVQEIHVVEPRVVEIGLINDNEPILAFDIGDNKILY